MEKKLYELSIDPEIQGLLPPLRDSEWEMLEESLLKEGCLEPILVWGDTIIDGHARYALCHKHRIPFSIHPMRFADKDEAKLWVLRKALGQRNVSKFHSCEMALVLEPETRKKAKENQHFRHVTTPYNTRKILAQMAMVSEGTMRKAKLLMEKADDQLKDRLRRNEISIDCAYRALKERQARKENLTLQLAGN